jgi:hypothetical protein
MLMEDFLVEGGELPDDSLLQGFGEPSPECSG